MPDSHSSRSSSPAPTAGKNQPKKQGLQSLRGLRIVVGMMAGMLFLLGLAAVIAVPHFRSQFDVSSGGHISGEPMTLLLILVLLIPVELVVFFKLKKTLRKQMLEKLAGEPYRRGMLLPVEFGQICLIGATMTSGIGFFAIAIYVVTGSLPAILVALCAALLLLWQLPSDDSFHQS